MTSAHTGRPAIYLVGGPSGAGKDTLLLGARKLLAARGAPVVFITRQVTREAAACTEIEQAVSAEAAPVVPQPRYMPKISSSGKSK